jgi:integrase
VFTYTVERSRGGREQGRAPADHGRGLQDALAPVCAGCGIAEGFRRHDTRHTAGTRYVRATGNLKGAQRLLGHARIETTTRYAHVLLEDIRAGQEAVERGP